MLDVLLVLCCAQAMEGSTSNDTVRIGVHGGRRPGRSG